MKIIKLIIILIVIIILLSIISSAYEKDRGPPPEQPSTDNFANSPETYDWKANGIPEGISDDDVAANYDKIKEL